MRQTYLDKFVILLVILLIIFAVLLQVNTLKSTEKIKNAEVEKSEQYAGKIAKLINFRTGDDIEGRLTEDPKLRMHLNETLHAFLTSQYQYIFVLKKDDKNNYRFLLDASNEEEYQALFFPKSKSFDTVYRTGKMQIVEQHEGVEEVWLSLVYPIVINGKTEALLVLDLSESYDELLSDFNTPLMNFVWMMQAFLLLSLLALLYLAYRYYKTRKALIQDSLTSVYTKQYLSEFCDKHSIDNYDAMLIDMDEFKQVNHKYGEAFGDKAIRFFAKTMVGTLPQNATVVRVGGTEFLVILPKIDNDFEVVTNTLFETLKEKKYLIENEIISLPVSMSAMSIPEGAISVQNIQRLLDEKLLEVKSKGKNGLGMLGIKHHDDVQYSNIDFIKEALENERLTCLYQPIFNTKTKEIVKYEALVRLIDKEDPEKLISPFYFMDVIKGTSQYIKMSKLVFKHVFDTLNAYPEIEISVNVDLKDLYNNDMMNLIQTNLLTYKKTANRLTFEILEEHEVEDYDKVEYLFKQLKAYGSKVALDDFGSGFANYSYLIRLDLDILKIDGSLIRELQNNTNAAKIVLKSIQELAVKFNYQLVAEFVSHQDIYEMVKDLDIEQSQGFYLGEPRPITDYMD